MRTLPSFRKDHKVRINDHFISKSILFKAIWVFLNAGSLLCFLQANVGFRFSLVKILCIKVNKNTPYHQTQKDHWKRCFLCFTGIDWEEWKDKLESSTEHFHRQCSLGFAGWRTTRTRRSTLGSNHSGWHFGQNLAQIIQVVILVSIWSKN